MGEKYAKDHARAKAFEAALGALIGISTVLMIQLLSIPALDQPLTVSLYSVAVSIPTLSACLLMEISENHVRFTRQMWYRWPVITVGILATLVAIAAAFLHFSQLAAVVFITVSFWGLLLWSIHLGVVKSANLP